MKTLLHCFLKGVNLQTSPFELQLQEVTSLAFFVVVIGSEYFPPLFNSLIYIFDNYLVPPHVCDIIGTEIGEEHKQGCLPDLWNFFLAGETDVKHIVAY